MLATAAVMWQQKVIATTAVVEPGTCKLRKSTQHNNTTTIKVSRSLGWWVCCPIAMRSDEAGNSMLKRLYCHQHATDFPAMISGADSHTRALLITRAPEPAWQAYTVRKQCLHKQIMGIQVCRLNYHTCGTRHCKVYTRFAC